MQTSQIPNFSQREGLRRSHDVLGLNNVKDFIFISLLFFYINV